MLRPTVFVSVACLCALAAPALAQVTVQLADESGRPVADAIVSLVPLDAAAAKTAPALPVPAAGATAAVEITQRNKDFTPLVTVVRAGSTVTFSNRDKVQHHIYSLSAPKKFEIPLHRPGHEAAITFDQPGVVACGCNIHDWMSAYVVVVATPWFAKSGAEGTVTLPAAPAGRYRAEVWHWRLAQTETRELTLPAAAPVRFTLALQPDERIRRGADAATSGYR